MVWKKPYISKLQEQNEINDQYEKALQELRSLQGITENIQEEKPEENNFSNSSNVNNIQEKLPPQEIWVEDDMTITVEVKPPVNKEKNLFEILRDAKAKINDTNKTRWVSKEEIKEINDMNALKEQNKGYYDSDILRQRILNKQAEKRAEKSLLSKLLKNAQEQKK